jgi:glutathione S-transferase
MSPVERQRGLNLARSGWPKPSRRLAVSGIAAPSPSPKPCMANLYYYPFCPNSRFVRLVLAEMGMEPTLREERPWERRREFLALDPAGATPLLVEEGGLAIPGAAVIAEYLDETRGLGLGTRRLLPDGPAERVEVRRLLDWFLAKFHEEVTGYLVHEKIVKRFIGPGEGGGAPDMAAIRAARNNVRYHLKYIGYLIATRNWLAGDHLTYADLAAAAHLSCADYCGDVPWDENDNARGWYARVKSRPAFRALLSDRVPGMAPAAHYANLDF